MRIDVVSIFPEYLRALDLSLPGKARDKGILDLVVHDLREWTHDRHRTVDDTPYGGGAGMVMKPEPWGEALDAVVTDDAVLVVPTPSGERFTQAMAQELAAEHHLVFACGRYEGIDQRVFDEASTRMQVKEVSLGDYVLNGGEVAVLAIIEAVARLLPGFMGNAASLAEESHTSGLLEYPVYTKPAQWRGRDVPSVLLSGDHARIAEWRLAQSRRRTSERRPDLLHQSQAVTVGDEAAMLSLASIADAGELLTLERAAYLEEADLNADFTIPPVAETLADVEAWLREHTTWALRVDGRLIGAVRGRLIGSRWEIGRLVVAPDLRGRGWGGFLLDHAEAAAPPSATELSLFTGRASERNLRAYRKRGYRLSADQPDDPGLVRLSRSLRRPTKSQVNL